MKPEPVEDEINWRVVAIYGGCVAFWIGLAVAVVWATH